MGLRHHSIVILRNSWDQEAARDEFRAKIVAGVVPLIIGALLTLLEEYLRHKYWP